MPTPMNMELDITLTLSGQENRDGTWTLNPVYSVTRSVPVSQNVVTDKGAIDLSLMAMDSSYSKSTVLKFTLISTVHDNVGNLAHILFPVPRANAVEFTAIADPVHPPAPVGTEFTVDSYIGNPHSLIFTDIDNSVGTYEYCLKVACWNTAALNSTTGATPALVRLDPPIKNRAGGN